MRMRFGKYKGRRLEDIPADYLQWVLDNAHPDGMLRRAIQERLSRLPPDLPRGESPYLRRFLMKKSIEESFREKIRQALKAAYREMALRHHPDRGGSHEAMIAVNDLYERFEEILARSV
jgi:Putative quorum-sensing-regulated virulence factor